MFHTHSKVLFTTAKYSAPPETLVMKYLLLQAIDDRYAEAAARLGPDQEVIFEGKQITLDIPKEGIMLESGWTITPFTYPGVSTLSQHTSSYLRSLYWMLYSSRDTMASWESFSSANNKTVKNTTTNVATFFVADHQTPG